MQRLLAVLRAENDLVSGIDGSTVGRGCMILMLSVIYRQQAIPVVWTVVRAQKGHLPEAMHRQLLARLSEIVPTHCRVTIMGDGECDGLHWQADILSYGWDYVLRTGKAKLAGQR